MRTTVKVSGGFVSYSFAVKKGLRLLDSDATKWKQYGTYHQQVDEARDQNLCFRFFRISRLCSVYFGVFLGDSEVQTAPKSGSRELVK